MHTRKLPTVFLALLALSLIGAQGLAAAALKVSPPELKMRQHQLANGMKVILHEDRSVPAANVQVWYHVGSKDERQGRSGFAHLFEHIMFKGSANVGPEEHGDFINSIGGRLNATTDFDRTLYFQTFPSQYLERILWMEADRMRSLNVSEENFVSERDVVKEERRMRIENPPFGRLFEVVLDKTFTTHPYRILPIGSMADLTAATIEDVREFHRTYYVPNNATLVVAGDFDADETLGWIEKHFAAIPKGPAIPRNAPKEPAQTAERRTVQYDANTPLPAVIFTYHVPEAGHPDLHALQVAANVLSNGQSSRLYRKMVYEQQIALEAGGQTIILDDPGVFFFFSILQAGKAPGEAEKALAEEAERLRTEAVGQEELEKAKNQLIAAQVFERQTVQAKASDIGYADVILGDVSWVNRELAELQKVTAADVQRVAGIYFRPENRTVVHMLPMAMKPGAQEGQQEKQP
ncbi:MAG TPA: pitrilysin family protein [Thermoanaerobaculia bacterium]|nr:pitrilysin family protein [Thermoanaerobaculia bacterium]